MLWRGVTANPTGGVSGSKGAGETRLRKTDQRLRILVVDDNRDAADNLFTVTVGHFLWPSGEGARSYPFVSGRLGQFSTRCRASGSTGLTKCCSKPASCERRRSSSCS